MLKFLLIERTENEFIYVYYPEGNEQAPGIVAITGNKKGRIITQSVDDAGQRYAFHAIFGIDTTKESGIVAWY